MGLFKKLFFKKRGTKPEFSEEEYDNEDSMKVPVLSRDSINIRDTEQRERYVTSCLEQMKDAEEQIAELTREYGKVTSYLTDMEEIESLPAGEKKELGILADKITAYESEKNVYEDRPDRMSDQAFVRMESMEKEVEEGIGKLTEAEEYQQLIRRDLQKLGGERHAYKYRRLDLLASLANLRGMMVISCVAFGACMLLLLLMSLILEMDIRLGCVLATAMMTLVIFLIYLRYNANARELKRVDLTINKLILLQNRVKIRFVNNTNLLDYYRTRYQTESAEQLGKEWGKYLVEKAERARFRQVHEELAGFYQEMIRLLRRYRIRDPEIWLHQTQAINNHNEMVEIRHGLILRRQKLRKQMEYNQQLAEMAKDEIKGMVDEYPQFREEILFRIDEFERRPL